LKKIEGVSGNAACAQLDLAGNTYEFFYSLYPPLAPLGETRGAEVRVSGNVGRDRTPPLLEWTVVQREMLAKK
jgi:hypothetical protein